MKKLFTLAVLLTSSLASAADGVVADLEDKYYAGLNFGAGWGGGFMVKPSIVFGYHYDKNSKFELEVLSSVKSLNEISASLLANYCFYPDLDIDPVKLYVSGGLGGYVQLVPNFVIGNLVLSPSKPKSASEPSSKGEDGSTSEGESTSENESTSESESGQSGAAIVAADKVVKVEDWSIKRVGGFSVAEMLSVISYKLKVGVDYEIAPHLVGTAGVTMDGNLGNIIEGYMPNAALELGVRYNF